MNERDLHFLELGIGCGLGCAAGVAGGMDQDTGRVIGRVLEVLSETPGAVQEITRNLAADIMLGQPSKKRYEAMVKRLADLARDVSKENGGPTGSGPKGLHRV